MVNCGTDVDTAELQREVARLSNLVQSLQTAAAAQPRKDPMQEGTARLSAPAAPVTASWSQESVDTLVICLSQR